MTDHMAEHGRDAEWTVNSLKAFFEAVLEEQRRGVVVAEQEREKAAKALRDALERNIQEGDRNLRDHIENQVMQIRAALKSADLLEVKRIELVDRELEAVKRELTQAQETSTDAVAKAEEAINQRLGLLNEFRSQMADESRKYAQREVVDNQILELSNRIEKLDKRLSELL